MQAADPARQLHDARQLQRLRALRERTAMNALRAAEAEERAAELTVREREAALQALLRQRPDEASDLHQTLAQLEQFA